MAKPSNYEYTCKVSLMKITKGSCILIFYLGEAVELNFKYIHFDYK